MSSIAPRVVYALNEGFIRPTCVSLDSLLAQRSGDTEIFVLGIDLSDASKEALLRIADNRAALSFLPIDPCLLSEDMSSGSKAGFSKYFLPKLLSGRVIQMDADTLIRHDIAELYNTDMEGAYVAGVSNFRHMEKRFICQYDGPWVPAKQKASAKKQFEKVMAQTQLSEASHYINGGVMLMDLDRIRATPGLADTYADYRSARQFRPPQQTWIARHLSANIKLLHPKWNYYSNAARAAHAAFPKELRALYRETSQNPAVVHFVGKSKPWDPFRLSDLSGGYRWRKEYRKYLSALSDILDTLPA